MNDLQSVKAFLSSRRSYPPALLGAPYPDRSMIETICQAGLRVPDHKKLEPWRLVVLGKETLGALAKIIEERASAFQPNPEKAAKITALYQNAGCVIAMVYSPVDEPAIPEWEQHLSMGAVGVSLVNAAIAHGFGAHWATGFLPECEEVLAFLELGDDEKLAGLVHIGTPKATPPERPRPDMSKKLSWR